MPIAERIRTAQTLRPELLNALREGYSIATLRADLIAGLTVAIVALPLSMAIAIAAGGTPAMGLYTAIFGGFFVSALGGSRHQIGGPAGAFIVLMAATAGQFGVDGLILATFMSGIFLVLLGVFRLGSYIKFIPYPVVIGFTAGIAVIIFSSQIRDLLGLTLIEPEPGALWLKLPVIWASLGSLNVYTVATAAMTIATILILRRFASSLPGLLIAVVLTTLFASAFSMPISTIGSMFGAIPAGIPLPHLPEISIARLQQLLPSATAFTLLGTIESLLSAVVADGMTGRHHNSNAELVGQGVANMSAALFGGMAVTGTVARTATNVRAGAATPLSGVFHSGFLLVFVLIAAPLASFIPLASLAGVLAVVAWDMIDRDAILSLFRASRGDATVLLVTFLLTIFRDLTEAIVVGFALGSILFIHRMSKTIGVQIGNTGEDAGLSADDPDLVIYRIRGAVFFGAAASVSGILEQISDRHKGLVLDFSEVPYADSTAAHAVEGLVRNATRRGIHVALSGVSHDIKMQLSAQGLSSARVIFADSIAAATLQLRAVLSINGDLRT
jgi:SulP family sulfate permease